MNTKTFERMVCTQDIPDKQVRDAFGQLVIETFTDNDVIVGALELLGRHRQGLAGEISREIISYTPKEQIKKVFDSLTQEKAEQPIIAVAPENEIYPLLESNT